MRHLKPIRTVPILALALVLLAAAGGRAQTPSQICDDPNASDDATITACTQVIQSGVTGTDLAYAYNNRGTGYAGKGRDDLALADYNQALTIDPNDAEAWHNRAAVYFRRGQYDSTVSDDTQAIRVKPAYSHAYAQRGYAYFFMGSDNLALADYDQSVRIDPTYVTAFIRRGYAFVVDGRYADASQDLVHALGMSPNSPYVVLWLHIARMRAGIDDTRELAANSTPLDKAAWPAAIVDFYRGNATAEATMARASTAGQRCEANFYIGEWQLANSMSAAARTSFENAEQICPLSFLEAVATRAELRRL